MLSNDLYVNPIVTEVEVALAMVELDKQAEKIRLLREAEVTANVRKHRLTALYRPRLWRSLVHFRAV